MNTNTIEKLLQKTPPVRTPVGLLAKLQSTIELPRPTSKSTSHELRTTHSPWFRRWMPALGFAIWFLGCVVVFGIQAGRIAELRTRQQTLESAKATAVQQAIAAEAASTAAAAELEQLKKDLADVQRLRAEIEQLRADLRELATLHTQNQRLREQLKSQAAPAPKPEEDFFANQAERPNRIKCINNLKQLGLAARIWATTHGDVFPPGYEAMKEEMVTDKISFCPSDGTTRMELLSPGASETEPWVVFTRCPIHNNVGLVDGSAQMLDATRKVVQKDGKWIIATEK